MLILPPPFLPGLSRRRFLSGAAALGAAATLGATTMTFGPRPARAQTPVRGGKLTIAYTAPVDTIDPRISYVVAAQQVTGAVFENLVFDNNGVLEPRLATSWRSENNLQEWVFELREGVRFHDGAEFTSKDVVETLNLAFDKERGRLYYNVLGPLKSVAAEGPHRVRLTFSQPFADAPYAVALRFARILPAHRIATIVEHPVGTGPFRLKTFEPGNSATIIRNPDYWNEGKPYLDEITIVGIADSITQQAAIRSGAVDVLNTVQTETFLSLRNAPGLVGVSEAGAKYHVLITQINQPPFDNPKVREAFRYIINRKALIGSALLGQGAVAGDFPFPYDHPNTPADLPRHEQDLPKARRLLDEAGVGRLDLDMWTMSERPPSPKIALALKEAAARINVNVNVSDVPYTEYAANVVRKKPLYTTGTWTVNQNLFESLYKSFHSKGTTNYSATEISPGADAAIEEILATPAGPKRLELIHGLAHKIAIYSERTIPYYMNTSVVLSERVRDFPFPRYDLIDLAGIWVAPKA